MNKAITLIGIVVAIMIATVSAIDKNDLLKTHNAERALVGAKALTWSNSLAKFAQNWANHLKNNGCRLKHRSDRKVNGQVVGENLAMWFNGSPRCGGKIPSSNDAYGVCLWNEEKNFYVYGKQCRSNDKSSSCAKCTKGACGHYTQVTWAGTTQMGCGIAKCSNGYELLVCNYAAAGNYIGQYPFPSSKKSAYKKAANYGAASKKTNTKSKKSKKSKKSSNKSSTGVQNGIKVESTGNGCRVTNVMQENKATKRYVKVKCGNQQQGIQLHDQAFIKSLNNPAYDPEMYQQTILKQCSSTCEVCSISTQNWGPWC